MVLQKQSNKDGPLGVGVYAASGISFGEGCHEERGALRGLEGGWRAEVDSFLGVSLLGNCKDVDVFWFHEFFLDARGCEVDEITLRVSHRTRSCSNRTYLSRMLVPPPVPVTHPRFQKTLQRLGIMLAGCWLSSDWTKWSLLSICA